MSVMVRVSEETHKTIKELAERERRSITSEMELIVQYAKYYLENREREDRLKNASFESVIAIDEFSKRQQERKEDEQLFKVIRDAAARQPQVILSSEQLALSNPYSPDTYEWYKEEAYSRELSNEEMLRMNELGLIKQGWSQEAAHKKIYC